MANDTVNDTPQDQPEEAPSNDALPLIVAARSHFVAVRDRSIANLNNYIFNAAGVGEHPDVVQECINLVEEIDHAESVLQTLARITQ